MKHINQVYKETKSELNQRINKAHTINDLQSLDKLCEKMYNAGTLSVKGYQWLTIKIMDKIIALENPGNYQ